MCQHERLQADSVLSEQTGAESGGGGGDFALPDTAARHAPDLLLEPTHLDLTLHPDLDARSAEGRVVLTVVARSPGAQALALDAVDLEGLVAADPDGHDLSWSYDGRKVHLRWETAVPAGQERRVELRYRVVKPIAGLYFGGPDPSCPQRGRYAITDHETERARYWLPCVDHPAVRTTLDVHLRGQKGWELLANGALMSEEDHGDGTRTAHWRQQQPCPSYLLCLAAGEFVRCEDGEFDGRPLAYFALPPYTEADLRRCFGRTGEMLQFLTTRLGRPLPWPKYYQFSAPEIGGAMENISLVSWDDLWMFDERLHAERGHVLDQVNVHEMAHTWFGDSVVIRDFAHAWLKESWATYLEACWYEHTGGPDALHYQLLSERREYMDEADHRYARAVVTRRYDSSWKMFDRHLYPGGALRIHMLRELLGDAVFWPAVTTYLERFEGKTAETEDFRKVLEEKSGRSLTRFFDQWLYSPGYPKLTATYSFDAEKSALTLDIEQTQPDEKKGIGLFSFPLEVAIELEDGSWSRRSYDVAERRHAWRIPVASRPRQVIFDPESRLLHQLTFDPGQEMLIRTLREGPWVGARIHAGATLAKSGKRAAIAAIQDAYGQEASWGVRIELARALGSAGTADAVAALAALIPAETDPKVMSTLMESAAHYRDADLAQTIAAWLDRPDMPYRARAQALIALGMQRGETWLEKLKAASFDGSWWGWVRSGAISALGATRTEKGQQILLDRAVDAAELAHVRKAAMGALAATSREMGASRKRRAVEVLSDLCRDPRHDIRLDAVRALQALADPRGTPAIEAARGQVAGQEQPTIDRALAALRASGPGAEVGKLRQQVEDLETRLRKMQKRVEDLEGKVS